LVGFDDVFREMGLRRDEIGTSFLWKWKKKFRGNHYICWCCSSSDSFMVREREREEEEEQEKKVFLQL
jgi:hypothetical protein